MSHVLDLSGKHPDVELRQVIITRFRHKGTGASGKDVFRLLTDVWTPEGQLLASEDSALEWILRAAQKETAEAEAGRRRRMEEVHDARRLFDASTVDVPLDNLIARVIAERDALREHLDKFHICGKACKAERP